MVSESLQRSQRDTVEVHVWQAGRMASLETLVDEQDPDVYHLPPADPPLDSAEHTTDEERVVLADSITHHGTYAFDIPDESRPATLHVHTNDSYHSGEDWGRAVERGLTFHKPDDLDPFGCELWGRVLMWVEVPDDA